MTKLLKCWICLSIILLLGNVLSFGQYNFVNIPLNLIEDAHTIVRESSTHLEVHSPGSATLTNRKVATILNEYSTADILRVFYDPMRKIQSLSAKIYNRNGQVIANFKKNDFEDISYVSGVSIFDDNRWKYLEATFNEYPYTVEFEYKVQINDIIDYPDYYPQYGYGVAVENSSYSISNPGDLKVRAKVLNFEPEYHISNDNCRVTQKWSVANLKALKNESLDPPSDKVRPQILIAPSLFEADGFKGDMSDWSSYGTWYFNLNKGRDKLSPDLANQVKELVKNASTEREKVDILYRFMQSQVRYVSIQLGIGGWQTFEASYVEENKYGDCKALTNYLKSMLKVAEVEAYEALVFAGDDKGNLQEDFSQNEFNHVILYVPNDGDEIWLECTSQDIPPNYLGNFTDDRFVLLVTPEGGQLKRTPKATALDNQIDQSVKATLGTDGALTANLKIKATGTRERVYRSRVSTMNKEDQKDWFKNQFNLPSFDISQLNIEVAKDSVVSNTSMTITIPKYASTSGSRIFLTPNILNRFNSVPKKVTERNNPLFSEKTYSEEDQIQIQLPNGYALEANGLKDIKLETIFGTYEANCVVENGTLTYIRKRTVLPFEQAADQYNAYRDFLKKIKKYDNSKVVLVAEP